MDVTEGARRFVDWSDCYCPAVGPTCCSCSVMNFKASPWFYPSSVAAKASWWHALSLDPGGVAIDGTGGQCGGDQERRSQLRSKLGDDARKRRYVNVEDHAVGVEMRIVRPCRAVPEQRRNEVGGHRPDGAFPVADPGIRAVPEHESSSATRTASSWACSS